MSKKGFKKRLFASIFSFYFIVFQFFIVPSAMAWPNFDLFGAGWEPVQKILNLIKEAGQGAMKTSVSTALSYFLQTMAKDVAQGIVTGSVGQEPLFRVETFTTSLKNAADNATGVFLDDLSERGFDTLGLCKPINVMSIGSFEKDLTKWLSGVMQDLTSSLNLIPDFGDYDLTNKKPTCTVGKVIETMQDNIDYILGSYFEYLFLDIFKKNCNIPEIERFENDFSNAVTSFMGFSFSILNPFSIIPSAEELAGSFESLNNSYNFQCRFFVCKDKSKLNCNGDDVDWTKTSEKIISETVYPVIINSLKLAFGDYDVVGTPEETLKFQVAKNCYNMAEEIDDSILSSIVNPDKIPETTLPVNFGIDLFKKIVRIMNPYYIHPDVNYLEHFKKNVYIENKGGNGPVFLEGEEDNWLKIYKNNQGNVEFNSATLPKIQTADYYKKDIKDSLTTVCMNLAYDKIAFFPQIARREYNESLEKIRKHNEEQREEAKQKVVSETPNPDIGGTKSVISSELTTTSTQTTQMVQSYQNSLQDFLTPTGDVWLDAGKLFLATLLEGYFEELKKGIFQLPNNFAFNDFENFGNKFLNQFNSTSDWFGDANWGEALLADLVGAPKTGSSFGQACLRDGNCATGLFCEFVGSDKICIGCIDGRINCPEPLICYSNKCVECVFSSDCEDNKICSDNFICISSE